jgi:ATP-dependent DNA helicase RecQ
VVPRADARQQIRQVLARHPGEAGIIYCLSRKDVDSLAGSLRGEGVAALPYHAGLADDVRHAHQDAFIDERVQVMVATVAFGMGIDRPDVRFVLHVGVPRSLEHYQQEAGRAGRDGLASECVLISSPGDFARWRSLLEANGGLTEGDRLHLREIERYASATSCRHRALVEYFGQEYTAASCGACDWCLGELQQIDDALTVAQKILSCVVRTGQRFGVGHVVSVLAGQRSEAVLARGHHELSTFGLLADTPHAEIRGYLDQLTQGGFLVRVGDQYPVLQVTEQARALLRGEASCMLYRQPRVRRPAADRQRGRAAIADLTPQEQERFERLRAMRLAMARDRHVPPYVIFHDTTLREIARLQPRSIGELRGVTGIGERKAELFGDEVLAALAAGRGD